MGLFSNSFGNAESQRSGSKINWVNVTNITQLEQMIDESEGKPVIIFKHSTRCGISRMVLKRFENEYNLEGKITPYFLDLLAHRHISDAISQQFGVVHQSPQLLLIKNGKSVYNVSHDEIDASALNQQIAKNYPS